MIGCLDDHWRVPTRTLYDAAASSPFSAGATGSDPFDRSHQFRAWQRRAFI
jgi:hypothetical protein